MNLNIDLWIESERSPQPKKNPLARCYYMILKVMYIHTTHMQKSDSPLDEDWDIKPGSLSRQSRDLPVNGKKLVIGWPINKTKKRKGVGPLPPPQKKHIWGRAMCSRFKQFLKSTVNTTQACKRPNDHPNKQTKCHHNFLFSWYKKVNFIWRVFHPSRVTQNRVMMESRQHFA